MPAGRMWFQKAKITVNLGEESEAYKHRNYIGTQPPVKRHNKAETMADYWQTKPVSKPWRFARHLLGLQIR